MITDWKKEILDNIALSGSVETKIKLITNGNLNHILNLSSGSARLQTNVIKKFKLITSQPNELSILNPFEIRCSLCRKVISYPAWYYSIQYAVNHFHYFICFDDKNSENPTTKCYRREG